MAGHHIAQRPILPPGHARLPGMATVEALDYDPTLEWWTPYDLCAAAREVLGGIELDPASCAEANLTVQAERFYTREQDGLAQDWTCRSMWLNSPFGTSGHQYGSAYQGQSICKMFLTRLKAEYDAGRVGAAIALLKSDPKSSTFQPCWSWGPIAFCRDRIYFDRPNRKPEKIQFGTALVYLGSPEGEALFIDVFRKFGRIARAVDPAPEPPTVAAPELWSA